MKIDKRSWVWLLCALWLVGCSYEPVIGPRRFNPATEPTLVPTRDAVARPVYEIEQGLVTEQFVFDARVSPRTESTVIATVPGQILDIDVQVGDFVSVGDRLARYDFRPIESEIAELQEIIDARLSQLASAEAEQAIATGRAQLELDLALLELSVAEQTAVDAPSEANEQRAELLRLRVELAQNSADLVAEEIDPDGVVNAEIGTLRGQIAELSEQTAIKGIYADADGMILSLSMNAGNRVSTEQSVAVIGNMGSADDVSISAVLRSETLERLMEGMITELVFSDDSEQSYPATIVRLPYPYNVGGNDLGFDDADKAVRILPDDPRLLGDFALGDLVSVTIVLDENPDALWLPAEAIREFSGRTFIVVREGDREQRIDVERGLQGDGRVEIVGGVTAGQLVVGP